MSATDAYVFVDVAPGETTRTARRLKDVEAVTAVHVVTGEYDIVAQIDAGDPDVETHDWLQTEIDEDGRDGTLSAVIEEIQAVEGVDRTTTSLAFDV